VLSCLSVASALAARRPRVGGKPAKIGTEGQCYH
jgi:hypothetical protein